MSSPTSTPEAGRELVVVFPDEQQARAAGCRLEDLGVPAASIRIGAESDHITALRAEMREELRQAWIVPTAGAVATREILYLGAIATLLALVIGVPLAFVDYGSTLAVRLVTHVAVALVFGGLVGSFASGARNAQPPDELLAAQRGTVLRVAQDTPAVREALAALEPIRLDEVATDDTPLDTAVTEGDTGVVQNLPADAPTRDADTDPDPDTGAPDTHR